VFLDPFVISQNAEIVRTRDQTVLDTCDIVVDVGGVYDPKKERFDHHQRYVGSVNKFSWSIALTWPWQKMKQCLTLVTVKTFLRHCNYISCENQNGHKARF